MQSFTVSTTSRWFTRPWHVQLATTYGTFRDGDDARRDLLEHGTDICSYTRSIMWGLLYVTLLTAMFCGVIVAPIGDALGWVVAGVINGFVRPDEPAMIVVVMLAVVVLIIALLLLVGGLLKVRSMFPASEQRSLVGQMYDSFKNSYCVRLNFTSMSKGTQ